MRPPPPLVRLKPRLLVCLCLGHGVAVGVVVRVFDQNAGVLVLPLELFLVQVDVRGYLCAANRNARPLAVGRGEPAEVGYPLETGKALTPKIRGRLHSAILAPEMASVQAQIELLNDGLRWWAVGRRARRLLIDRCTGAILPVGAVAAIAAVGTIGTVCSVSAIAPVSAVTRLRYSDFHLNPDLIDDVAASLDADDRAVDVAFGVEATLADNVGLLAVARCPAVHQQLVLVKELCAGRERLIELHRPERDRLRLSRGASALVRQREAAC